MASSEAVPRPPCSTAAPGATHRDRAARQGAVDFLHDEIADRLLDRLDLVNREFPVALDLGARDGGAGASAGRDGRARRGSSRPSRRSDFSSGAPGPRVVADPELLPFRDASFDLVASNLALHWAADLPGVLVQLRRALKPDGLLLAAMLGGQTLDRAAHRAVRGRAGGGGRGQPARVAVDRAGRRRRAVAARRLCAAGRRQRDDHRHLSRTCWR